MNGFARVFSLVVAVFLAQLIFHGTRASCRRAQSTQNSAAAAAARGPAASDAGKKRVAVLDFYDVEVGTYVLGDRVDVGKAMAALLAQQLAQGGAYAVVDATTVSVAVADLHFTKNDRVDREFAVKLGKRLGVDALIVGDVTLFGRDPKLRPMPSDEMRPRKIKARITVEARLIEVATDMIVAVASGRTESKREGFNLLSGGSNWHGFGDANVDFGSREFQETILGEAVNDAVQQLATSLAADASQLGSSAKAITGLVVSASGAEIVLNIGAKAGLKVGDQMEVERIVRNIPDAANGELSRLSTTPIGIIRVDTVHDTYSVATKISGDAEIKVGDHVKGPAR